MIRGLNSAFWTTTRALQSSQYAMLLHAKNISNASDPTYTRQILQNPVDPSGRLPYVARLRDMFIDEQFRFANANVGDAETRREIMNRIEDIFGDPINSGLGLAIDKFFDAFKAVSEDPSDTVLRLEALEAGRQFVQQVQQAIAQLSQIRSQIDERIQAVVLQINAHLKTLHDLNSRIAALKNTSEPDADLQDQRDRILDELAKLTGAKPTYLEDGTVRVMIGSVPAVDGLTLRQLDLVVEDGKLTPKWPGLELPPYSGHGVLPALLKLRDEEIDSIIASLDQMAKNLARAVNDLHVQGYDLDGKLGQEFFLIQDEVPGGIAVNPALTPRDVAAAGSNEALQMDGTIADKIYQLSRGMWPLYPDTYTRTGTGFTYQLTLSRDQSAEWVHTYDTATGPATERWRGSWQQNPDGSVTVTLDEVWDATLGKFVEANPPMVRVYRRVNGELVRADGAITYKAANPDVLDTTSSTIVAFRNLVGLIGSRGRAAKDDEAVALAHVRATQEQRSSKWGVSVDEEIALMTAQQKAFAAVARVMNVLDEMLELLINTGR